MKRYLLILILMTGCSTFTSPVPELTFEHDGTITTSAQSIPQEVKAGEKKALEPHVAILFEAPGRLPALILPASSSNGETKIRLAPLGADIALASEMDQVLEEILSAQILLREKKGKEALAIADKLLVRYPRAKKLRQLKASCLMVMGEKASANALLQGDAP